MNKLSVNHIVNHNLCYGCGTCNVLCGRKAITMVYNEIGQLSPNIDSSKCIDCGLCYDFCPSLDKNKIFLKGIENPDIYVGDICGVYTGNSSNAEIYKNSQSGGVVTSILYYLFDMNLIDAAVVCVVDYSSSYKSKFQIITTVDDLAKSQKSSYTPVDMVSAIKNANKYKSLAVVGTGCHIQGFNALRNFSNKYSNIHYLIGLVCDRTLCLTVSDIIIGKNFANENKKIIWRDKTLSYETPKLIVENERGNQVEIPSWQRHYLKNAFTSPRCRICTDKLNVKADIVCGDPWGMPDINRQYGNSLIITRTPLGQQVIGEMCNSGCLSIKIADFDDVIKGQAIDTRKRNVDLYSKVYLQKGWLLPSYLSPHKGNDVRAQLKMINSFLKDSQMSKNKIIRKYKRKIVYITIKRKLYSYIQRII